MRKRTKIAAVAAAAVLAVLAGGVAYASIPGSDGVIHGCYKTNNPGQGALIAIDSVASCPSGYSALNWRQGGGSGMVVSRVNVNVPFGQPVNSVVTGRPTCPAGYVAVGGGFGPSFSGPGYDQENWTLESDFGPTNPPDTQDWYVVEVLRGTPYTGGGSWTLSVFVNCLPTSA